MRKPNGYSTTGFAQPLKKAIIMHTKSTHKSQMPTNEVEYAIRDLTNTEYKLLTYYYSKNTGWVFHDDKITELLNVSPRRFKEVRKSLVDKGYLLITGSKTLPTYFVGRGAVSDWQDADNNQPTED